MLLPIVEMGCGAGSKKAYPRYIVVPEQAATAESALALASNKGAAMPSNDNGFASQGEAFDIPDAHGQAALVLVESLINGLIERSVLTASDSIEIIETAIDVQTDVAEAADGAGAKMWRAHSLLSSMAASLRYDIPGLNGSPLPT